jgi:hypothetical protein
LVAAAPATAESRLIVGPRTLQELVVTQLFDHSGRWYWIADGGCHTYLDSPRTQLQNDRLVLHARLTSRLGQDIGGTCAGADFASGMTLSGKLRGQGQTVQLEDIHIDRIDDDATRSALNVALQLDPSLLPRTLAIDVADYVRRQVFPAGGAAHLEEFHILGLTTRPDAVEIDFEMRLKAP